MWSQIKQRYLQKETDSEAARRAALLLIMLRVVIVGACIFIALPLFFPAQPLGIEYIIPPFMVFSAFALSKLAQRGYVRVASIVWTLLFFCSVSAALWISRLYIGFAYGYFLVLITATLLLGKKSALLFDGLCILFSLSSSFLVWESGHLEASAIIVMQLHWTFINITLTTATFLLFAAADNITNALKQAHDSAQALQESEIALRAYADRLEILHEIDQAILGAQSAEDIARVTLAHLQPLIPTLLSSVVVFDLGHQQMTGLTTFSRGQHVPELEITLDGLESFNVVGLTAGQIQNVPDMSQLSELSSIHQYFYQNGMRSYINVPLLAQGQLVGTLNLGSESLHFFTAPHLEIAQEVADSLAIAIHQAQLREQVQQGVVITSQLLHEINHRVGNNLMAIIGLLHIERRFAPEGAGHIIGPALERLEQRITALAEVHKLLSGNSWGAVNLQELITRLTRQTLNTLSTTHKFEVNVSPTEISVSPRQANHLALVISELAANVAAYAHTPHTPGRVDVAITAPDHTVEVIYRDDGPGYPDAILREGRFNVGLYLIQRIVITTLHGGLKLYNDNGAVAVIHFEQEKLGEAPFEVSRGGDELSESV